jgi:hypothetical protein
LRLELAVTSLNTVISNAKADLNFEKGLAEQYALEMTDANKTPEEREFARVEEERARLAWTAKELEVQNNQELLTQAQEEYNFQKDRLQTANDLLQIAEDAAAANLLAIQTETYNTTKARYEELKTEYDGLVA